MSQQELFLSPTLSVQIGFDTLTMIIVHLSLETVLFQAVPRMQSLRNWLLLLLQSSHFPWNLPEPPSRLPR